MESDELRELINLLMKFQMQYRWTDIQKANMRIVEEYARDIIFPKPVDNHGDSGD